MGRQVKTIAEKLIQPRDLGVLTGLFLFPAPGRVMQERGSVSQDRGRQTEGSSLQLAASCKSDIPNYLDN